MFIRIAVVASIVTLTACSSTKEPEVARTGTTDMGPVAKAADADDTGKANVALDPELAKLCDMPTAYFAFDSAHLSAESKTALSSLADCFTTGKAKGKTMSVIGHADPRGEAEYNLALGQRRAGAVAQHVIAAGLTEDRVESSSRGELEARGIDEASWAKDRRVMIGLAGE